MLPYKSTKRPSVKVRDAQDWRLIGQGSLRKYLNDDSENKSVVLEF